MRMIPSLWDSLSWHPVVPQEDTTRGNMEFWKYTVSGSQLLSMGSAGAIGSGSWFPESWSPGIWYLVQEKAINVMRANSMGVHLLINCFIVGAFIP
jgi:hypothetical protein